MSTFLAIATPFIFTLTYIEDLDDVDDDHDADDDGLTLSVVAVGLAMLVLLPRW